MQEGQVTGTRAGLSANMRDIVVLALGFGCLVAYVHMSSLGYAGYLKDSGFVSADVWGAVRSIATLAALALLAFASWSNKLKTGKTAIGIAAFCAAIAPILAALDPNGAAGALSAVVGGCAAAVLMYVWLLLLGGQSRSTMFDVAVAGLVIAAIIVIASPLIGTLACFAIATLSACVAGLCAIFGSAQYDSLGLGGSLSKSQAGDIPWFTIVCLAATGFASTLVYAIARHITWLYDWQPNYLVFGVSAIAVIVATFGIIATRDTWKRTIWAPQLLLLMFALALSCFSLRESFQGAMGFLLACVFCAQFLYWPVFASILRETDAPKGFLAALMLFLVSGSLADVAGTALGSILPHSTQNLGGVAGLTVIAMVIVLGATNLVCRSVFKPETPEEPKSQRETLEDRIIRFEQDYGLTPRESEVALLTAQGFSSTYIAEKLVVSVSTIRFHQQNLFRKMDVHSRNEFIERAMEADSETR